MAVIKEIRTEVVLKGRQDNQCWFAPTIAVVPSSSADSPPEIHIGAHQLTGNDMGAQHWIRTKNLGKSWTPPMESQNLLGMPREDDFFEKLMGFSLLYHRHSGRLMSFGATQFVRDEGGSLNHKLEAHDWGNLCPLKNTMFSTEWDFENCDFTPWKPIALPPELMKRFESCNLLNLYSLGDELPDGTVLGTIMAADAGRGEGFISIFVVHLEILPSGEFTLLNQGNVLRHGTGEGFAEPSIIRFEERYYMTIRHVDTAYVTGSEDGLHYNEPIEWRFDDGEVLGSYNTQQRWLVQEDSLFLVYTRRSELNRGVFRARAPLFIAQVDPENLCVIRNSERIVFPEKGARMGNFSVVNVTEKEAWVVTGEWLQGMDKDTKPGDRFYWAGEEWGVNRIQYIGDLLLGRIVFA